MADQHGLDSATRALYSLGSEFENSKKKWGSIGWLRGMSTYSPGGGPRTDRLWLTVSQRNFATRFLCQHGWEGHVVMVCLEGENALAILLQNWYERSGIGPTLRAWNVKVKRA